MRNLKRILAVLMCVVCLLSFSVIPASAADITDMPNDATANWAGDAKKELVYSRPMFEHTATVDALTIKGVPAPGEDEEPFSIGKLYDIYAQDGKIYLLDEANGQLIVVDEDFNYIAHFSELQYVGTQEEYVDEFEEDPITFIGARGILVDKDDIYIADFASSRLLVGKIGEKEDGKMDVTIDRILVKPTDEMWPEGLHYQPTKIVKDTMGYIYVISEGCYYGAVMYSPEFKFQGFFGANVVSTSVLEAMNNLWDMLFSNNEKLSKSEKKLPFSFVDMVLGPDGCLYTCTGSTSTTAAATGSIKRLNPTGTNILKDKTGTTASGSESVRFATNETIREGVRARGHDLASITIDENGFILVLDVKYGRVYMYDIECNLLNTFGGGVTSGSQYGTFKDSKALTSMNGKVYIIDSTKNSITVFKRNAYGDLVESAQAKTIKGNYVEAEKEWLEVLKLDRNCLVAYRGIAKSKVQQGKYSEAMYYAKLGEDRATYSRAYEFVRKEYLEKYFLYIVIGLVVLVALIATFLAIKKKKNIVLVKNRKWQIALGTLLHPADTFYEIKRNKGGSVIIATIFLAVWYIFKIIGFSSGFIFNTTDIRDANAWYALAQTFGLVLLFTLANWAVCTLMEGKGKLKDIYVVTCYSLIPMIFQAIAYDILANVLTLNEANILSIINYVCLVFTLVILVMGLINIHEYSFGKFVFTTVVTVLAMMLIVFLVFMLAILIQQTKNFVETIYLEAFFR